MPLQQRGEFAGGCAPRLRRAHRFHFPYSSFQFSIPWPLERIDAAHRRAPSVEEFAGAGSAMASPRVLQGRAAVAPVAASRHQFR